MSTIYGVKVSGPISAWLAAAALVAMFFLGVFVTGLGFANGSTPSPSPLPTPYRWDDPDHPISCYVFGDFAQCFVRPETTP